jgi:hypothetical protein
MWSGSEQFEPRSKILHRIRSLPVIAPEGSQRVGITRVPSLPALRPPLSKSAIDGVADGARERPSTRQRDWKDVVSQWEAGTGADLITMHIMLKHRGKAFRAPHKLRHMPQMPARAQHSRVGAE